MYNIYNGAENNCNKIFVLVFSMGVYYGKEKKKFWVLFDWILYTHILSHNTPWLANLQKRATTMYLLYITGFYLHRADLLPLDNINLKLLYITRSNYMCITTLKLKSLDL